MYIILPANREGREITNLNYDFEKLFASTTIHDDFCKIWTSMIEKTDDTKNTVEDAQESIKDLVLYDALDGGRTTLTSKGSIDPKDDIPLFSITLIHTLQALGAKSCIIMIHTFYNRKRGKNEFNRILNIVKSGSELIKQYSIKNDVRCHCLCINKNYELIDLLREVERQTHNGSFNAYFLFDYNEEWYNTEEGFNLINTLPDINVHIRHTKLNFSGGWIPSKMKKSAFLYSQNGARYSNWEPKEVVALVAMALLAKKFNEEEGFSKIYSSDNEIQHRYIKREIELFEKTAYLREHPRKLFIFGSSIGPYKIYY